MKVNGIDIISMESKLCLTAKHYSGKKVIFTKTQRELKSKKHSILRDDDFISGRLKNAIESPSFVYQDLEKPKSREIVYLEEFMVDNRYRYTKVVLEKKSNYFFVVSAYRPDFVKERGKTKLIYGKDNAND